MRCTIALTDHDGLFCDSPVPADAPVSACVQHLREAWLYCQGVIERATDEDLQSLDGFLPSVQNQTLMDRLRQARSVVYYALTDGYIKIGTTVHLDQRMKTLGANLIAVEAGGRDLERQRHQQFADLLATGREYFRPGPDLIGHIAALQEESA